MRPSTPEAPTALLPPPPLRLLPGGAIQFPGGFFLPLWTSAFSRRTVKACLRQLSGLLSLRGFPVVVSRLYPNTHYGVCGPSPIRSVKSMRWNALSIFVS